MRDILSDPQFANLTQPPRVVIDSQDFVNNTQQRINKNLITRKLAVDLSRAAKGRMVFVNQINSARVVKERALKRSGVSDVGTSGLTKALAGVDYFLAGEMAATEQYSLGSGLIQRYNQITFELIDAETGISVWSNQYEFERAAADDVIYR